jgi:hypothetical protein
MMQLSTGSFVLHVQRRAGDELPVSALVNASQPRLSLRNGENPRHCRFKHEVRLWS